MLDEYGDKTGYYLENLTHSEEPWQRARKTSDQIINKQFMKQYYGARLDVSKTQKIKNQSQRKQRILKGQSETSISDKYCENFRVSFEYLDRSQGQTFQDWEQEGLLSKMNDTLASYCKESIRAKQGDKFKEYGEFPSRSSFTHPKHVAQDVNWSSLHITGKTVLGGFISGNTFFVVFLDKEHKFWICEKKHT